VTWAHFDPPRGMPRIAVVGVRRVRTGLGCFLAKHLVAHGAAVPAFLASRRETIDAGRASLAEAGIDAEGFVDLDELLRRHAIDALVIATPHETHLPWLRAAVGRGLHVLCEKPLVWGDELAIQDGEALVGEMAERGLVLFENCPWPYALPAFDRLHPGARRGAVRRLEMELAPSSSDPRAMVLDVMSHPISFLQALSPLPAGSPGHGVRDLRTVTAEPGHVELSFAFAGPPPSEPIATFLRLVSAPAQPRPMALVVNGFRADRRVRMEDYSLRLADGEREVPLPDPMEALVADFVRATAEEEPAARALRTREILERLFLVRQIVGSFAAT
jgi:predicted dehydrogenase